MVGNVAKCLHGKRASNKLPTGKLRIGLFACTKMLIRRCAGLRIGGLGWLTALRRWSW